MPDQSSALVMSEELLAKFAPLESREKLLAIKYVEYVSVYKAAKEVGIKRTEAEAILMRPLVREYVNAVTDQLAEVSLINKVVVERYLLSLVPKVTGEEEVAQVYQGGEFMGRRFDGPTALRLASELGKHAGIEKASGGVSINLNFGALGVQGGATIEGESKEID